MDSTLKNYGSLIEKIRKDRKLSREALCEGIMSKRNYQRFASGEVSISSDKILLITDKLMLDTYSLQEIYKTDHQDEYLKLKKAFNAVSDFDEQEASVILATIDYDAIDSKVNKQMYEFTKMQIMRKNNKIIKSDYNKRIESLIDFPNILKKKLLNSVELSGLFSLMTRQAKTNNSQIVDYLINLVHDEETNSYWMTHEIRTGIYANITRALYHMGKYEECHTLCVEGLASSKKTGRFIGLFNLLGHKILSQSKLGKIDDAIDDAIKLYMHVLVEGDINKISLVKNIVKSNLKINIDEILQIKKEG